MSFLIGLLFLIQDVDTLYSYSGDGCVCYQGLTWSSCRDASSGTAENGRDTLMAATSYDGFTTPATYGIARAGISFPPLGIGSDITIDSVLVQITVKTSSNSPYAFLTDGYAADSSSIADGDYPGLLSTTLRSNDSITGTGAGKFWLDSTAISGLSRSGGCNKFSILERNDLRDFTPSDQRQIVFYSRESSTQTNRPILVIYTSTNDFPLDGRLRGGKWLTKGKVVIKTP